MMCKRNIVFFLQQFDASGKTLLVAHPTLILPQAVQCG